MKAVVLAAGRGKRLGRLGNVFQKCMYPLWDRPFLAYVLDVLTSFSEIEHLYIVVGHKGCQIKEYFGCEWRNREISYVTQHAPYGTADALYTAFCAFRFFSEEPILVVLGDVIPEKEIIEKLLKHPSNRDNVLTVINHPCKKEDHARITLNTNTGKDFYKVEKAWNGSGPFVDTGQWILQPRTIGYMGRLVQGERRILQAVEAMLPEINTVAYVAKMWLHLGDEPSLKSNLDRLLKFTKEWNCNA